MPPCRLSPSRTAAPASIVSGHRFFGGFTLVELLVVIGIIALLMGVLLPVLGKARKSAQATADASNLKQIVTGAHMYAALYKGAAPYGFIGTQAVAGATPDLGIGSMTRIGTDYSYMAYFSLISNAMNPKRPAQSNDGLGTSQSWNRFKEGIDPIWRSPGAAVDLGSPIHYSTNTSVLLHMPSESRSRLGPWGPSPVIRSRSMTDALSDTALFWNQPLLQTPTSENGGQSFESTAFQEHAIFIDSSSATFDKVLPITQIDGGRTSSRLSIKHPTLRFSFKGSEAAATYASDPVWSYDEGIYYTTDELMAATGKPSPMNADLGAGTITQLQVGNMRYRFGNNDLGNVAFGDGSVRPFKLNKKQTYSGSLPQNGIWNKSYRSEFKRRFLLSKPPSTAKPIIYVP
jgi:prepilin-type N-terminal cleavage/methylation domain-containing protein/prepilin-type processing-associated H-X9-DG protein